VLQVLPALEVGGVERGTLEVAAALVKQGHKSIVISSGGHMVEQLEEEGSIHIKLPIGKKSPFTFKLIPRLKKIFNEHNIDIIHVRSRMPAWVCYLTWRSMPKETRPVFITTVHGPYSVNFYSKIMVRGECIIAISEFIHRYISKNYPDIDKKKIQVIYRGVDPKQYYQGFEPSPEWLRDWKREHTALHEKFLITLPARITRWKGHDDFIEIISKLRDSGLPVHGLIAGGAHPRRKQYLKELQSRIHAKKLDDHITFLGHRNDMKEIMSISDIVLSLAKEPEAFGRTALEALSLGTPVVAYNHGGAVEVLDRLFPRGRVKPFNIDETTRLIIELYKNPTTVKHENPFTLESMLNKTITLYENNINKNRATPVSPTEKNSSGS
jgi:glycosyltransferase involved in cell wall biosynthesis